MKIVIFIFFTKAIEEILFRFKYPNRKAQEGNAGYWKNKSTRF
jgi:hypothetical protein